MRASTARHTLGDLRAFGRVPGGDLEVVVELAW
jgi:hypothetical protein